jgi:outer membrane protein OmpA-like peptidoglycan-associated protein
MSNEKLGMRRAETVMKELASLGVIRQECLPRVWED